MSDYKKYIGKSFKTTYDTYKVLGIRDDLYYIILNMWTYNTFKHPIHSVISYFKCGREVNIKKYNRKLIKVDIKG